MKKIFIIAALFAILASFGIWIAEKSDKNTTPTASSKLQVVASFYPLYFLASEIGGDAAEVYNLTPAGAEPHDYEPTARDTARIETADLLVLNGVGLEAWAENIEQRVDTQKVRVVFAAEGLATRELVEERERMADPHVWLDPELMLKMADTIERAFAAADPANADRYATNARSLKSRLAELDAEYAAALKSCARKDIVTSHDAFGYLAAAYGLTQTPIAGLSPEAEPSPRELIEIAKFAKDNAVTHIFFESLVSPKLAETLANEIGAKTLVLNPLEGLSAEEMAEGKDYVTEMRANLASLILALQCTP
jgi:zinc transport system substrate-binding protein